MYIDIDRYEPNSANVAQAGYKPGRLQWRRRAAQPGFMLVRDCDRGTNSSNQHVPARTHEFRSNNATLTLYAGSNEFRMYIYIYVYIYIHILRTKSTSRRQPLAKALLLFNYKQIAWRLGCVSQAGKVCPRSCQRSRAGPAQMRLRKAPELFRISGM